MIGDRIKADAFHRHAAGTGARWSGGGGAPSPAELDEALDTGAFLAELAWRIVRPDFDLDVASAYNSEIVKNKIKTIQALGLNANLEDMLLTLDSQLHLIKMLSPTTFMYLAADRSQTNLALLRSAVNRHVAGLNA